MEFNEDKYINDVWKKDVLKDMFVPKVKQQCECGRKFDADKPRWDLLPWEQVKHVVQVLTHGAKKYDDDNWMKVPHARKRYFAAAMRHLMAWWGGEKKDAESGLPHLAHAGCCLLFLAWFDDQDNSDD